MERYSGAFYHKNRVDIISKKAFQGAGVFVFIPFERVGSDRIYFRSAIAAEAFFC
jgi:hypothetical protein